MRSLTLTIVALFAASPSPLAFAGAPSTVAVAVDTAGLAPAMANQVQDGAVTHILAGLTQVMAARTATNVSLTPVTDPSTLGQVLACDSPECLRDLAQSAGIDLVLQVRVRPAPSARKVSRRAKPDYLVSLVAVQALPHRDGRTEETECRACGSGEIKHSASLLASVVAERIALEPPPSPRASEDVPGAAVAATPPAPPAPAPPAPAPPPLPAFQPTLTRTPVAPKPASSIPPYLSVAAVAGGTAVLGAGFYLLSIDGQGSCDLSGPRELCARRYKTRTPGIALAAGGGALALGGLVGLLFLSPGRGSTRVAFNLSASSLVLSGGF